MGFELASTRNVMQSYGPRATSLQYGAQTTRDDGIVKEAIWTFTYDKLPTYGASNFQFSFPANCTIVRARLIIDTAFTSTSTTTDLDIGLYTSAGVAIDADGLIAAATATQTAIAVENSVITGAGALIGVGIGATAGELVVTPTANDLLTGAGRIVVEYIYNK